MMTSSSVKPPAPDIRKSQESSAPSGEVAVMTWEQLGLLVSPSPEPPAEHDDTDGYDHRKNMNGMETEHVSQRTVEDRMEVDEDDEAERDEDDIMEDAILRSDALESHNAIRRRRSTEAEFAYLRGAFAARTRRWRGCGRLSAGRAPTPQA